MRFKSPLIENIEHQNLYVLNRIQPRTQGELVLQEAAQAELFRRIERSTQIQAARPKRLPRLPEPAPQETA